MSKSRNVTIRLSEVEFNNFNSLAKEKGLNRTDLIRNAVMSYSKLGKPREDSIPISQKASEIVSAVQNKISIADFSHPILHKAEKRGIVINDESGNIITTLRNLKDILDFVQERVLKF